MACKEYRKKEEKCHRKEKELKIKILTEANWICSTKIRACDIPYTITRPGTYILCDNIIPPVSNLHPIRIQVSDDLQYRANVGITISSSSGPVINNVVIKNGTIKNTPGVSGISGSTDQTIAVNNDVTFPLVAVVAGLALPPGPSTSYPVTAYNITVAGILAYNLNGAIFKNVTMYSVLYGLVALNTIGYVRIDKSKFFNFGAAYPATPVPPPGITPTPTAYGSAVFLAGTVSAPAVDLRMTNCDLNSQVSKFATVVLCADGCVWERNSTSSDSGPNPSPTGNPLIQGPIEFINCSAGIVRECESRGSNTMLETQYCEAFEFIDCTAWEVFHNGIGILFCSDVVLRNCIVHRAEAAATSDPAVATGSGIKINISNYVNVEDCVFTGFNQGVSPTDSNGAGIAVAAANYAVVKNNKTSGNNWGIKEIAMTTLSQSTGGGPIIPYHFSELVPYSNNYLSNFSNANMNKVGAIGANYLLLPPSPGGTSNFVISISTNGITPVPSYVNLEP